MDERTDGGWLGIAGDVCVVTGAVGGMGTAIAAELAHAGARLALVDIGEEHTAAYAAQLAAEYGVDAHGYGCDVSDADDVEILRNRIVEDFGTVDVLVNTVGILRFAPLEDLPLADWKDVINVNLTGAFILSQAFGKVMLEHKSGRIVHISTVASHSPETFSGAYSCAKAGLGMLSKMIAAEWGPFGIRSNCVCPCFVKTPMSASFYADPKVTEERERLIASRRIGEVEDSAVATVRFESGTLGTITLSDSAASPWNWESTARENPFFAPYDTDAYYIMGTKASLSLPRLHLFSHAGGVSDWTKPFTCEVQGMREGLPHRLQLRHFERVIRGEETPLVTPEDAIKTLEVLAAVKQAADGGGLVRL